VLRGNALGQPQIINMLPDERVKPGERVITSGGDQIFPRGLPVGVVDQVVPDTSNPPYIDIVIKPAANLGHLEELLVITEASDRMSATAQQDLAQSAAEGAAVSKQKAADILAERLPGLNDPNALADPGPGQKPATPAATVLPPLHPPPAVHPDHYSPDSTPPANALVPGQAVVDPKYAPLPKAPVATSAKPAADGKTTAGKVRKQDGDVAGSKSGQPTDTGAAVKPKHPATAPVVPADAASPSPARVVEPKIPKAAVPDQPTATPAAPADGDHPQ
jgi:rod shape-determining protein MreC